MDFFCFDRVERARSGSSTSTSSYHSRHFRNNRTRKVKVAANSDNSIIGAMGSLTGDFYRDRIENCFLFAVSISIFEEMSNNKPQQHTAQKLLTLLQFLFPLQIIWVSTRTE